MVVGGVRMGGQEGWMNAEASWFAVAWEGAEPERESTTEAQRSGDCQELTPKPAEKQKVPLEKTAKLLSWPNQEQQLKNQLTTAAQEEVQWYPKEEQLAELERGNLEQTSDLQWRCLMLVLSSLKEERTEAEKMETGSFAVAGETAAAVVVAVNL